MGRQRRTYHPGTATWPEDFPHRLERLKNDFGLSWRELSRRIGVDVGMVPRWRAGTKPGTPQLYQLCRLAARLGLLDHLLQSAGEPAVELPPP